MTSLSPVWLFVTPWTVAYQAPNMGFSRQEYWSGLPFKSIRGKQNWKMEWEYLFSHHCQGMFNSRIPVCCFLSLLSPLFLVSPLWGGGAGKPLPGPRSKRWDACIGFPSLAFPFGERDCLRPSFDMDCLLTLWLLLLLVSLVTFFFFLDGEIYHVHGLEESI